MTLSFSKHCAADAEIGKKEVFPLFVFHSMTDNEKDVVHCLLEMMHNAGVSESWMVRFVCVL